MRHVCVFGGGAALAAPLIRQLLQQGDRVTALCRNRSPGDVDPHPFLKVKMGCDACDDAAPWAGVNGIDALAILIGDHDDASLVNMEYESFEGVVQNNLTGPFNALKHLLPGMNRPGNVVVVGSIVGSMGGRGCCNYAASKAGLVGLVRAAANEWAKTGVVVNLLELGYVAAGMGAELPPEVRSKVEGTIPVGRFGKPEEFVHAMEFLMTTRYMTGGVLTLAGGLR